MNLHILILINILQKHKVIYCGNLAWRENIF